MKKMRGKKGVSLLEIVIAAAITAAVLVVFLRACTLNSYMLKSLKYRIGAINIARDEMEGVKALGYDNVELGTTTTNNVIIDDDITGTIKTKVTEAPIGVPADPDNPIRCKKVVVRVDWQMLGRNRQELLETVLYSHH